MGLGGLVRQARVGLLGVSSSPVLLPGSLPLSGTSSPAGREIEAAVALQFITWAGEAEVAAPSIMAEI